MERADRGPDHQLQPRGADGDDPGDVQDALLAAGKHLRDSRGEGAVEGWVTTRVARACSRLRCSTTCRPGTTPTAGRTRQVAPENSRHTFARWWLLGGEECPMNIDVRFPGGKRVAAQVGAFTIVTDQPVSAGGDGSAPAPFDLFLASIATCAGIYALGFCQARGIPTDGLRLVQHVDYDEATGLPGAFRLELTPPLALPEKYRAALLRSVEMCKVKKTLAALPAISVGFAPASEDACVAN